MIITKPEYEQNKHFFLDIILKGGIFIFPSDTIYGIGCLASNTKAIKKIRELKNRPEQPFAIYAPSKKWIKENTKLQDKYLKLLPGKYTFITKPKKLTFSKQVIPKTNSVGVRLPNHWISNLVKDLKQPIVATSVNQNKKPPMTSLTNMDNRFNKVDFIIKEGTLNRKPSAVIDATTGKRLR